MERKYPIKISSCVSALDKDRLEALIERSFGAEKALNDEAKRVLQKLRTAELVVDPDDVPRDLVTMNSMIKLADPFSDAQWEMTLVYPEEHDPSENSWSILSPIGSALFGLRLYEHAKVKREDLPSTDWVITDIPFQPEKNGWMTM